MNRVIRAAALTCLLSTSALAQNSAAVGTGVGVSEANSASGAIAVNRGNGGNSSLTVNNPANTTATVNQNLSGATTSNINANGTTRVISSGTTTLRSAPPIAAPGLSAAGLETCLGSASGGISAVGFGITGGASIVDEGCQARLDSRTLAAYGLKAAAVARLCQRADIWRSMPDVCAQYWPVGMPYPAGIAAAAPLVAPSGTYMTADAAAAGVIRVIDGRDGVEKDCLNYSPKAQKCFHWLGEPPRNRRQRVATNITTPHRAVTKPKPKSADPAQEPPTP